MEIVHKWPLTASGWREKSSVFRYGHGRSKSNAEIRRLEGKLEQPRVIYTKRHSSAIRVGGNLLETALNLLSLLWFLLPRRGRPVRNKALHELHALAYLDALRGWLAMIIFTGHTMRKEWRWIPNSVLSVPGIQFLFRGGFTSLDIFFWISGYAITYRIVGFMQTKKHDKVLDTLASSIFRRYLRLFLPMLPVTLFTVLAVRIGLAIPPENKKDTIKGNPLWWWVKDSAHALNPFTHILGWWDGQTGSELLDPFWSLSAEFRSSMTLFTFCTGTCKMSSRKRRVLIWLCIPAFMAWSAQWAAMSFLGMWFAEYRQERVQRQRANPSLEASQTLPTPTSAITTPAPLLHNDSHSIKKDNIAQKNVPTYFMRLLRPIRSYTASIHGTDLSRLRQPLLLFSFAYSFVFLVDPYDFFRHKMFPHNILNYIAPEYWHSQMKMHLHLTVGALMMLYPLDQMYALQRPLLTPFSQYLGELSFGIYAVHFTVRWIVWDPRYVKWQSDRYGEKEFDRFWVLFPGYIGMAICVLWAADLFRCFDMQVVKLCKKLEDLMFE